MSDDLWEEILIRRVDDVFFMKLRDIEVPIDISDKRTYILLLNTFPNNKYVGFFSIPQISLNFMLTELAEKMKLEKY